MMTKQKGHYCRLTLLKNDVILKCDTVVDHISKYITHYIYNVLYIVI